MTRKIINVGSANLAGDGEPIRSALVKVNDNFEELYDQIPTDISQLDDSQGLLTSTIQETNTATDTALDLSKSIHKLANGIYTLADGAEGQIIYFVPQTGATYKGVELFIANARVVTNSHSQVVIDNLFLPFSDSTTSNLNNVVTLIFTDGAWNLSAGEWD